MAAENTCNIALNTQYFICKIVLVEWIRIVLMHINQLMRHGSASWPRSDHASFPY